eukprot:TRINITY_DN41708_c0_g1_i1.p1 TRINITY_DN41708_c0_g1~~TRINITY_DN41708_c0_g1_i1.p1  ORF type:complete len:373 (-),score=28.66 TRINITY_DN41708_c0_g1_i1:715-1833(-)
MYNHGGNFEYCCGARQVHLHVLAALQAAVEEAASITFDVLPDGFSFMCLPAVVWTLWRSVCRILGAVGLWKRPDATPELPRSFVVSFLRVVATLAVWTFHCLGGELYGQRTGCLVDEYHGPLHWLGMSLLIVLNDFFFIISTHTAAARDRDVRPARCVVAGACSAVLRRVVRCAPIFMLVSQKSRRRGIFQSIRDGEPTLLLGSVWPFVVELVCYATIHGLLVVMQLFGELACFAIATVLLAMCVQARVDVGPAWPDSKDQWWEAHASVWVHRLPMCLTTLLLSRIFWRFRRRIGADAASKGNTDSMLGPVFFGLVAALGSFVTGLLEWCWTYGLRSVVPWWAYPFPVKLPLIVSTILLLEFSQRRRAVAGY